MKFRSDGRHQVDRDRTKVTQTPHAILLSCSDSRVPPELIFDQAIGEIFVIRVAGPSLDDVVIASIESAVQSFSPQLLLVLGHTSCPLIEEAITKKQVHQDNDRSSHQTTITTDIRNRLNSATPASQQSANFSDAARVNAASIGTELIHKSTIIKREVEAGRLTIQHALYSVETGRVSFEK
jgi:carbonic anhydrase